jgi:hypothetical protein
MKVFAIASIPSNVALEEVRKHLPDEVPATLKLYLDGKVEQFWFRENMGPIFLMNVATLDEAKGILGSLPLRGGHEISGEERESPLIGSVT